MKSGTTDRTIEESVIRELEWDPRVTARGIGVSAKDGAVVLSGASTRTRRGSARLGPPSESTGCGPSPTSSRSSRLHPATEATRRSPRRSPGSSRVTASSPTPSRPRSEDGYVTLRGTVEWSHQREAAERPLEQLRGVFGVRNEITLKARTKPKAADLEEQIHRAIARMADLDARSIGVNVRNGTVHLRRQRALARRAAHRRGGRGIRRRRQEGQERHHRDAVNVRTAPRRPARHGVDRAGRVGLTRPAAWAKTCPKRSDAASADGGATNHDQDLVCREP